RNWPKSLDIGFNSSAALGDINKDGSLEVIINSLYGKVYAFNSNSSILENWPADTQDYFAYFAPAIGDIDADGKLEIIVTSISKIFVLRSNASHMENWPKSIARDILSTSAVVGDVDGNKKPDVLLGADKLYAWNSNGSLVEGWPLNSTSISYFTPALDDLDGDGDTEVVVAASDGYVYAWDLPTGHNLAYIEWSKFAHDTMNTGRYEKAESCIEPANGMNISRNTVFCSGSYNLTDGIKVNASNVTLDCNNATLNGSRAEVGILLQEVEGATIKNCRLIGYSNGIVLNFSRNNLITNNFINATIEDGIFQGGAIFLASSANNSIINNSLFPYCCAIAYGMLMRFSNYNKVSGNRIYNFTEGLRMEQGISNVISKNEISLSRVKPSIAILIAGSLFNEISNNSIKKNSHGLWLSFSSDNIIIDNDVSANEISALDILSGSQNNIIRANNISKNDRGI
ncbi:MAG: right-handed parallel beta-helix repeat-containing protein, partial [Nanoarchaeota archaeon]